jgi:NAD(P)-dependent dehydrogenase (short-subunit alcohol dehydrogenase family)
MQSSPEQHPTSKQNIVLVGSTGLIGTQLLELLVSGDRVQRYSVLGVTHRTTPGLDLNDPNSIAEFFRSIPAVNHVIVAAGEARFGGLESLDRDALEVGIRSKLLGQVHIALAALRVLPEGGSVTLTSGQLARSPLPGSAAVALVNGAIESFVRAIALDCPRGRRINVVSPGWIKETMVRMNLDPTSGTSARDVARLYLDALEGEMHGEVIEER